MGVDVSTWRARVGMFTQRTSQKSLLIFRAKNKKQSPNNSQAPGSIRQHTTPGPPTSFRETGSIQQDDYKLNSMHHAKKDAWILYSYIFLWIVLLTVSLIDTPSGIKSTSSCPPVLLNPDQNETSPIQLSNAQSLIILMCGDIEVNPGPSDKYEKRAEELTEFTVPVEDVTYPEYCCNIDVDFTLKKKDPGYLEQLKDIVQTACAMLNYAGGVITLNSHTVLNDRYLDEWVGKIQQQLDLVVPKEVSLKCIEMKIESGYIVIWLKKSWKFITYKLPFYIRRDSATIDGDMTMVAAGVDTKPAKVAGIQWNHLNHGYRFPLSEGRNLEFKCYLTTFDATSLMDKIINDKKGGEPILIRTLLAFTNTEGGGDVIIGIKEDAHGAPILEGQKLSAADEGEVQRFFNELMIKGLNGEQRLWPSTPDGSEWTIKFYTLRNCPNNDRLVLIHIRVNQIAGGVLADEPEAYTMTPEGNIRNVPLNEWKNCIEPASNKSAAELLTLGPQSEEQDNAEDDMDEEQFKQLVDDLKSHRVTLSLKHIKSASWTKDSEDSQDDIMMKPGVSMKTCVEEVSKSELLKPSSPTMWVPNKSVLDRWVTNNHGDLKDCVKTIAQAHSQEAVVIGTKSFEHLFPCLSLGVPQHHTFDFVILQGNAQVDLWIVFENFANIATCRKYANSTTRILRSQLLSYMHQQTDTKAVKLAIRAKVWGIADNCIKYETPVDYTESTVGLSVLQKSVAYCLLQGQSHIKNRLGEEYLTTLTKDQLSGLLHYPYMNVIVFKGPLGSGKSIMAQYLCEQEARDRNLDKDKILYICPCEPLAEFIKFQQRCNVKFTKSEGLIHTIREALENGILLIIIDDAHLFQCSKDEWTELLNLLIPPESQCSTESHLAVFLDPQYQNFQDEKTENLFDAISAINKDHPFCKVHVCHALPIMIRNSRNIFAFFKRNAEEGSSSLTCSHDFRGDGVSVTYILEDFFQRDSDNPVIRIINEIVGRYNFEQNFTYQVTDITILVDADGRGNAEQAVQELYRIFIQFYPDAKIQRASQFPVKGMVIEELNSFSGLETRVCVLVHTCRSTDVMSNHRYKCFVASRGITKLVFLLHGDTVDSSFLQLKFSEEKQWQKLTRQLLKEIPENDSSEEWLRTNVPDTECWHKTKPYALVKCQQLIKSEETSSLNDWMESNIPPAMRRDEQFVKTMIGFVCQRTIRRESSQVYVLDLARLKSFISALNCLYGSPESLQHQALDSVYEYIGALEQPVSDDILQNILVIMWSDGYISREVILSWCENLYQTSAIRSQGIPVGSERVKLDSIEQTKRQACEIKLQGKDLGKQIQERMRARQEVRSWMEDTAQLGAYWYDSPHYQRVTLQALCQLAVTWQGDTCKVDKDLIFNYIPQLYCYTKLGLQLLYAVQCVLYHLQSPPGLAVAVLQALLINSTTENETEDTDTEDDTVDTGKEDDTDEPLITTTDWYKWRNTQNPAYDEGRNIIEQQGPLLDLIALVSGKVTLTEMNGWISTNIPQDQMLDAFIIAALCLINRGEEVLVVRDWISQNVPQSMQTSVQDTLKTMLIQRCVQMMQFLDYGDLVHWVDRHILPAQRRDAQFVRAVVKAVCEETIHTDKIASDTLGGYLGAVNCLYCAPEALQHQALDSVYDHIRTLENSEDSEDEHAEDVLQEVLDIMWFDGYINRQVILSWSGNMEPAMRQACDVNDQAKDLEEQIQERIRTRQEVWRWMRDTTQLDYYYLTAWYNFPHYQRVVLHALCQLAVTWQDDKSTVDKDLLFHYIPQLFCATRDGLQLLYAVQCVLYHLQNPPGLAVAVLQAVLIIIRAEDDGEDNTGDEPVLTTTDWDKWRNTQNPVYDEGRNIIEQQGPLLDLIAPVSGNVTLTEINGWISANIPQDQMLDAFIIAAECLINRGEEVLVVRDWISQNVPQSMQTSVQDTLKTRIIQRCVQWRQFRDHKQLAAWVDRHILPAWRQDTQFVKAAIKAVCQKTIHTDKIDFEPLSGYIGALNCLYGAPEALQLQSLDSVYDHVRTLQNPEKVLQQALDIMWSDGYISRQVLLSWSGNMDQAIRQACDVKVQGKDLGEQIQERMRARQEVKRWIRDTTQLGYYWDDSPHYQRVALHALCQLAVTWQGDKCTVDKDLLFHYIPRLFCDTIDGLQLLYSVQCVLFQVQNPTGLAVAVLQPLLSIIRPHTEDTDTEDDSQITTTGLEPLITPTDWDEWRNTQNPVYDEGRNIIQQQGPLLDLMALVSGNVTLTEMNAWISTNIPHDQMLDAFIIAALCLIDRREEVIPVRDWISQNVPQSMQTSVQDTLKTMIIQRCVRRIQRLHYIELVGWVDRHILPAWRQDSQFVRAVIKAVCEGTIHTNNIDSKTLRGWLVAMNCLYGAPKALQLQALDSVYDHVRTQQHPEKVFQEVLDIMWSDGYISRQMIKSWSDNMDQAIRQACDVKVRGKDLGEQIQERMRARQEVRDWLRTTTQMSPNDPFHAAWYNLPHYQRVALHALCQLAVTWQGDTFTVDKDLLFHYIPQLFCRMSDGLQLLYTVQCVLHHLQNPPGLAVAVMQAVLIISRTEHGTEDTDVEDDTEDEPVITTTDWDKWRNTQNPVYDEGRNIIEQQGPLLELIALVSGDVTLTEINGWISTNIPQDQMLDAFIITAACLINKGEEVLVVTDWISPNVPQSMQTSVQDTLKTMTIQRFVRRIQTGYYNGLAASVDRHILPAWRQETQFVKAVIKAVCEETIHSDEIESIGLKFSLDALNCLYGAPEALQLQSLDTVYDHVRTLQNPEKVLQELLDIMWSDGYISRQVLLSWSGNMDQAMRQACDVKVQGKNLGEQIQERMRTRQEVRRWVEDYTQIGNDQDNLPHYQRVVLHALCQLAVTCLSDTCKVDKDLIFYYIPQLFCHIRDELQLLYAVQCVLYHLQNPPGLAEVILKALVSPTAAGTEPIIMESDLEEWSEAEHPVYEEGRETMLLAINNL